ncbi:CesT family type III secretion system chaperone, partial [Mesorhizobium japonicum]|uniref:CesT family type III secretion system chaperone n=1 Tax=Mesorhizobium japonicum TaxID=2066070 RepID=UPI003B5B7F1C
MAHFVIREVAFSVVYSPGTDTENITVFCDFGPVPEHQELMTYKNLMETNFYFSSHRSPAFCLNPENGHVLFMFVIELLEL